MRQTTSDFGTERSALSTRSLQLEQLEPRVVFDADSNPGNFVKVGPLVYFTAFLANDVDSGREFPDCL